MKKIFKAYFSRDPDPGWRWPSAIARRFEAESLYWMSPGYYFEPDSGDHAEFLRLVEHFGLDLDGEDLARVSGKEVRDYPYYRLTVKIDKDYRKSEYMDWRSRCPGDHRTLCTVGGRQYRKVALDTKKSKSLDIMALPEVINPYIYIISRRLKEALSENGLTGYRTVPCVESEEGISDAELALDASSPTLEDRAGRFQLIITARPECAPHVGRVHIRRRCASCGTVYMFAGGGTPWLKRDEPAKADFQAFRSYQSDSEGTFEIGGECAIVSARFIQLMEGNRFSGLEKYSKVPAIPYGVVPIREGSG